MNIIDRRIRHFKEHFTFNNNHKKKQTYFRIKHKLKELTMDFFLSRLIKLLILSLLVDVNFTLSFCKKEIMNSPTFQLTPFSENDICNKHKLLATSLQTEPNTRFISSSSNCSILRTRTLLQKPNNKLFKKRLYK